MIGQRHAITLYGVIGYVTN